MNESMKATLNQSWDQVRPFGEKVPELMFQRLFFTNPEIKTLFRNTDFASLNKKLFEAIDHTISNLNNLEKLIPLLEGLGATHSKYGVTAQHYDAVGASLLWTLEHSVGNDWTAETASAWSTAYAFISSSMQTKKEVVA